MNNTNYILLQPKPVLLFEIFLPKKEGHEKEYEEKLREVLDAFLETERLRKIPLIEREIGTERLSNPNFREDKYLNDLKEVISGYSIYEVKGRFCGSNGPDDEDVWVIRFIIQDPQIEGAMRVELIDRSKEVIKYLITKRFAEEIGLEDEIWFVEYQNCLLQRWVNESYIKTNEY